MSKSIIWRFFSGHTGGVWTSLNHSMTERQIDIYQGEVTEIPVINTHILFQHFGQHHWLCGCAKVFQSFGQATKTLKVWERSHRGPIKQKKFTQILLVENFEPHSINVFHFVQSLAIHKTIHLKCSNFLLSKKTDTIHITSHQYIIIESFDN